jgi:hypothetical protein
MECLQRELTYEGLITIGSETSVKKSVPQSQNQSIPKKRMVIEYILNKIQRTDFQYMMVFLTHTMHYLNQITLRAYHRQIDVLFVCNALTNCSLQTGCIMRQR